MPSRYFRWSGEQFIELVQERSESVAAAVHQDTLDAPLTNPVTGFTTDSRSAYIENCRANNLEVVGNDRLGQKPRRPQDTISESVIVDRTMKAEAILSDPARRRAWHNEQTEKFERHQRLINGR